MSPPKLLFYLKNVFVFFYCDQERKWTDVPARWKSQKPWRRVKAKPGVSRWFNHGMYCFPRKKCSHSSKQDRVLVLAQWWWYGSYYFLFPNASFYGSYLYLSFLCLMFQGGEFVIDQTTGAACRLDGEGNTLSYQMQKLGCYLLAGK